MYIEEKLDKNIDDLAASVDSIKSAIQAKGVEVANGTPISEYPSKVNEVYESGQENIKAQVEPINSELEKCLAGEAVEGKTWYDKFWDVFQDNGNRTVYNYAFFGMDISKINPKYILTPTEANSMFRKTSASEGFKEGANVGHLYVDFSVAKNASDVFTNSKHERLGVLDFSNANYIHYMFLGATKLHTVDKLIVNSSATSQYYLQAFSTTPELQNITIEGKIVLNGFDIHWSTKLSKASITSIINALSPTTTGLTVTLSKTAVTNAFGGVDSAEWTALIATKSNWTISLV